MRSLLVLISIFLGDATFSQQATFTQAVSPQGSRIAISKDKLVYVYDLTSDESGFSVSMSEDIAGAGFSEDENLFVVMDYNYVFRAFDLSNEGEEVWSSDVLEFIDRRGERMKVRILESKSGDYFLAQHMGQSMVLDRSTGELVGYAELDIELYNQRDDQPISVWPSGPNSLEIMNVGSRDYQRAEVKIDVTYKKKKHPAFKFKVTRPVAMSIVINEETYVASPESKDMKRWIIRGNGYLAEATFYADAEKGIWWEIASPDVSTTIFLSLDHTDTNDPREFVITSTADRGRYMVFNDEPDCNSIFTLMEPADSPTLLTGVARTYGTLANDDPCDKGKWNLELDIEPLDHILLGWIFASIQATNVRFMEE